MKVSSWKDVLFWCWKKLHFVLKPCVLTRMVKIYPKTVLRKIHRLVEIWVAENSIFSRFIPGLEMPLVLSIVKKCLKMWTDAYLLSVK